MSLCSSIETLAMAYLDDELVAEERRELELHLLGCASCKQHVDGERSDLALVRKSLVAPPAPGTLKIAIQRALDAADREAVRTVRRGWFQWMLPGAATLAAAAAIAVFVFVRPPAAESPGAVAQEAARQQSRVLPLEVQGTSTGPWLRKHFAPVEPPQFAEPGIELLGARLSSVAGHDAALVRYLVTVGQNQYPLTAVVMVGLRGDELSGGTPIKVGDRTLHVHDAGGMPAVTYVDEHNTGYTFAADRLTAQELLELVVSSDLIGRAQQGR
jgi:anti-sigma factor RsiW